MITTAPQQCSHGKSRAGPVKVTCICDFGFYTLRNKNEMKRATDFDLTVTFRLMKGIACKKSANYLCTYMQQIKTITVLCVLKIICFHFA